MTSYSQNIIVTGFGPFSSHQVNASWETVKLLPDVIQGHKVIKEEIPVCYDTVDNQIKNLWQQYNPKLVVHIGVSHLTDKITIETCANKSGYHKQDVDLKIPSQGTCGGECAEEIIKTGLNIEEICNSLDEDKTVKVTCSQDAGRYLCEYIYYTSLSMDRNITMFIHVPILDKPFSGREMADVVEQVIGVALQTLEQGNEAEKLQRKQ